ncbi:MAG: hypothetical protein DDT42_00675 [candidate division WS2 bacterium]|uniref:Uncharacterized protein n=1 Tax=Psychracetigena formicireducens TaxID=2986056 RepID=A0A9E2F0W1_PSYF1|nr:hypothetical protein [Candidatus Psychracetigena formicireducens]MBT9144824.1 hypothetical protein [Candidatus Psychracetigena formicireducens]
MIGSKALIWIFVGLLTYRARTTGKVFSDTARPLSGGVSLKVKEGIQ